MCGQKQDLDAIQVYVQTDGHLESALHVLVNVSSVLVKLNSKNTENIEVSVNILLSYSCVFISFNTQSIIFWSCYR